MTNSDRHLQELDDIVGRRRRRGSGRCPSSSARVHARNGRAGARTPRSTRSNATTSRASSSSPRSSRSSRTSRSMRAFVTDDQLEPRARRACETGRADRSPATALPRPARSRGLLRLPRPSGCFVCRVELPGEALFEEVEHPVERVVGGVAGLVDEMLGARPSAPSSGCRARCPCWLSISIAIDAVTEHLAQVLEPFGGHGRSPVKRIASTHRSSRAATVARSASDRPSERLRALPTGERQRRLAQHRREHLVVDRHREREAAGEAHADRADARTAALLVQVAGQRAQPVDDRRRAVRAPTS